MREQRAMEGKMRVDGNVVLIAGGRLLYDSMCGDATLFQRTDMVETGWKVVAPI